MNIDVSNKVVVVTGSSRGIGKELVKCFAKEKSKVVINYFNSESEAALLHDEIKKYNNDCLKIRADITKQEDVNMMYKEVISTFGKADILINNAGVCDNNIIQLMPEQQWKKVIDVNLTGTYLCSRAFTKTMIQQKSGKIINIASLKGQEGCEGQINYSASKAGLVGFTKALAKELGRYNIAVNAVCPGFVVTDMNRHDTSKKEIAEKRSLLDYTKALSDCINMVVFLSSDKCKAISGRVFNIDSRIN